MNGIDYIDLYYEFQDRFKPVKDFESLEEIVLKAMQYLVDVMKNHSDSEFIKRIHLVYPNYFREVSKGKYQPILDELICINDCHMSKANRESFRKRVCQHMGYYLKDESVGSPRETTNFIRISKALMENPKLRVKDFYIQKDHNSNSQYFLYYNSNFSNKKSIVADIGYPDELRDDLVKGSLVSYNNGKDHYKDYLLRYSVEGTFSEAKSVTISSTSINDVGGFYTVFKDPLSGHLVLLENSSLLYVYSQTAQIGKTDSSLGYGGIFALVDSDMSNQEVLDHIRFFRLVGDNISACIAHNIMSYKQKKEAIKSTVAAIMSRNMSHNLGSHYLYYTKNQLSALADKHSEKGYADSPDIRGAAKVLGYMQARMDYLATIVAGDKYPYGSVFFKDQIFDELTIDDFSKRHFEKDSNGREYRRTTNYLLQNLILSENFTRCPVLVEEDDSLSQVDCKNILKKTCQKIIRLQIMTPTAERPFTGSSNKVKAYDEADIKLEVSKLCIALPGGIMSIHAFYNVVENLIRNSAKYNKEDFQSKDELVFTIRIKELEATNDLPARYEFVIFDNKANAFKSVKIKSEGTKEMAFSLIESMEHRLGHLKILNENNAIDKHDKGLKEMLFSILWMRVYTYGTKYLSDILVEIDQAKEGEDRLKIISKYAFKYVAVDDKGIQVPKNSQDKFNLGIRFELPKYRMMENVKANELKNNLINKGLNNFTDILCVDNTYSDFPKLRTQFTRVSQGTVKDEKNEEEAVNRLRKILQERFTDFDKYQLKMEGNAESGFEEKDFNKKQFGIYFRTHIAEISEMENYAYCEAISGENFTKTMQNIFNNGLVNNKYEDKASEYFGLKIKEAALTRITLIDERFYNDMQSSEGKREFLELKNIRVLNLKEGVQCKRHKCFILRKLKKIKPSVRNLFDGNEFRGDKGDGTHFLSIHLGMIEKIIKDNSSWVEVLGSKEATLNQRINKLMAWLKDSFKTEKGEVFISIHSGRGNFSPDLDESLKHYPFISISAIESAYSNSKYLLAQLFYNTVYLGKGISNE